MTTSGPWLAEAAGGRLVRGADETFGGVVGVDTRLLAAGDAFVALPGAHVDGGRFCREALDRGARAVVAEPRHLAGLAHAPVAVAVDDPHAALHSIARAWRARLHAHAIGVTGAAGKSTTTEILATILREQAPTHSTRHGFNTHQGASATVAAAPLGTRALVVELGMRSRGDIAAMAARMAPTAAIITNIGPEHLEFAGTVADVARNKAELIAALPPGAPCVVPAAEPLLDPHLRSDVATVTHGDGGDVRLASFEDGVALIDAAGAAVRVRPGFDQPHNLRNLVAAVAAALALGFEIPEAIEVAFPPLRWERHRIGPVDVVMDCAKTSALALSAALESFAREPAVRRIAVLGEIPELGPESPRYHREAGRRLAAAGIDLLVAVGEGAHAYVPSFGGEWLRCDTPEEARALLEQVGRPGDRALVKGRSALALERMLA